MNAFGQQCKELRELGHTLPEIMQITGRPKTSVYFHIHDVALNAERMSEIKKASGERIRVYALARKGKSDRDFRKFDEWTPEAVLLLGHLLFDGEILRGKCVYNNRSNALLRRVETLMRNIYDFEPKRYKNVSTGVWRLSYHNVALGSYLQEKAKELLANIQEFPFPLKREFLRAFFDDEGCMDFRPNGRKRRIRGYQKDVSILETVRELLESLGVASHIVPPNEVVISGKENLLKFQRGISFSPGVFINGNRSNSTWKEHLEKREILSRAIASYKT